MANPLEKIDIISEKNAVLSVTTKQEAHEKGLLHRTVIGVVINTLGDHVLVKQTPDRQDAGKYVAPVGGHVQAGESEIAALLREGEEEIGLNNFTYKRIGEAILDRHVIGRHENHLFILYEIYTDEPFVLGDEAESYRTFTKDELRDILQNKPELIGDAHHFVIKRFYPELLVCPKA